MKIKNMVLLRVGWYLFVAGALLSQVGRLFGLGWSSPLIWLSTALAVPGFVIFVVAMIRAKPGDP